MNLMLKAVIIFGLVYLLSDFFLDLINNRLILSILIATVFTIIILNNMKEKSKR